LTLERATSIYKNILFIVTGFSTKVKKVNL